MFRYDAQSQLCLLCVVEKQFRPTTVMSSRGRLSYTTSLLKLTVTPDTESSTLDTFAEMVPNLVDSRCEAWLLMQV